MSALVAVLAVLVVSVAAHELAHLLAARLVGHEVFEIQIGAGPSFTERIGGLHVEVGLVPIGGHVQTGSEHLAGFRWRSAIVAGSGVAANLGLLVIGSVLAMPLLVLFNFAAIVANLWPGRRHRLGDPSSDGRTLFDLARGDADAIAEEKSAWFCVQADRARSEGRLDDAAAMVARGEATVGTTRALLAIGGVVSFEQRRFVDVVDAYARLIDDERVTVAGRAGFAADAAWSASLSDDPALRRLALPWAAFALAARPSRRRRIVHGLALVDGGDALGALAAVDGIDDPSAGAVRVLALVSQGRVEDARTIFHDDVADAMELDHPLRVRAAHALSGGGRI